MFGGLRPSRCVNKRRVERSQIDPDSGGQQPRNRAKLSHKPAGPAYPALSLSSPLMPERYLIAKVTQDQAAEGGEGLRGRQKAAQAPGRAAQGLHSARVDPTVPAPCTPPGDSSLDPPLALDISKAGSRDKSSIT